MFYICTMDFTIENYPDEVKAYLKSYYDTLIEMNFFAENDVENNGPQAFYYVAGPQFMKRWINGDLDVLIDEDDSLELILKQTIAMGLMLSLKDKGMIGMLDDENGEDFFFTTALGKKLIASQK